MLRESRFESSPRLKDAIARVPAPFAGAPQISRIVEAVVVVGHRVWPTSWPPPPQRTPSIPFRRALPGVRARTRLS